MRLTPKELEKSHLYNMGYIAQKRLASGIRLVSRACVVVGMGSSSINGKLKVTIGGAVKPITISINGFSVAHF